MDKKQSTRYAPLCSLDSGWNDGDGETMYDFIRGRIISAYRSAEKREIGSILVEALSNLNRDDMFIVVNHYVHNESDREIRDRCGIKNKFGLPITTGGIFHRRKNAIKRLKNILWQKYAVSDLL